MENCPQCKNTIVAPKSRLVQDECGHKKCRMCLLQEENGCIICNIVQKKDNDIADELYAPLDPRICLETPTKLEKLTNHCGETPAKVEKLLELDCTSNDFDYADANEIVNNYSDSNENVESRKGDGISPHISGDGENKNLKGKKYSKSQMRKEIKRGITIEKHITIKEDTPIRYCCTVCNKTFTTRRLIPYHNFCGAENKPFTCELCQKGFVTRHHYQYHVRNHSGLRPFKCTMCDKSYNQQGKLTRHIKCHTGFRPFVCQDCGKAFYDKNALKSHYRTHTGEKPYVCSHCGKAFSELVNMQKHEITHTGEKPFMCDHCGKAFGFKWALVFHQRIHSEQRPHTCPLCSRGFLAKKDLKRHILIHTGARDFRCDVCAVQFRRKDNLERHMKNTHPELRGGVHPPVICYSPPEKVPEEESTKPDYFALTPQLTDENIDRIMEMELSVPPAEERSNERPVIQLNHVPSVIAPTCQAVPVINGPSNWSGKRVESTPVEGANRVRTITRVPGVVSKVPDLTSVPPPMTFVIHSTNEPNIRTMLNDVHWRKRTLEMLNQRQEHCAIIKRS